LRQTYAFSGSLNGDRVSSGGGRIVMDTTARSINSASALAAHTAMCVQLESLTLRGDLTPAAAVKSRRVSFRRFVLLAAVVLAALLSARALSIVGSPRDSVVPRASAVLQR
jgi:hypothetical protein